MNEGGTKASSSFNKYGAFLMMVNLVISHKACASNAETARLKVETPVIHCQLLTHRYRFV